MISEELLNQVHELMDLAIKASMESSKTINLDFYSNTSGLDLRIKNENGEIEISDVCYLDWEGGTCCPAEKFPIFKAKLEGLLKKEEVA